MTPQNVSKSRKNSDIEKNIKKSEKSFEKGIDKAVWAWYNIKVAAQVATHGH